MTIIGYICYAVQSYHKTQMLHQYESVLINQAEQKLIIIWKLFNRVQTVGDNRNNCTLELCESGSGWIRHIEDDYLEFPDGLREVIWDDFDHGIEILTEYLRQVGEMK